MPPGTGKSLMVAEIIRSTRAANPNARVVVLTTTKELVVQNAEEFERFCPEETVSIYSAGLDRKEAKGMVIFGTINSMYSKLHALVPPPPPDLLIVDEAHLVPQRGDSMFGRFISDCTAANEDLQIVGLTATPFRMDSGPLVDPNKWLCPIVSMETDATIDVSGVKRHGMDYSDADLREAVKPLDEGDTHSPRGVNELCARGAKRSQWLVFCCGVEHTHEVQQALTRKGIACASILGDTPPAERHAAIEDYKAGRLRCLVNNNVLTTGFNVPSIDLVALLRPTLSPQLYLQMVGRGARIADGKRDCLVLDFGGNVRRHGLLQNLRIRSPAEAHEGKGGDAPIKKCSKCGTFAAVAQLRCARCGDTFPSRAEAISTSPDTTALLGGRTDLVTGVAYAKHEKPGRTPTLKVTYNCVDSAKKRLTFREWVCVEHPYYKARSWAERFPRIKAMKWWRARSGGSNPPFTVDEALTQVKALRKPTAIKVTSGEFAKITPLD